MQKALILLAALSLLVLPTAAADAGMADKAVNTAANTAFGWIDCGKAVADEVSKAASRAYVGTPVTAAAMCGLNVAVRYLGVAVDWATLPFSWWEPLSRNVVNPAVHESLSPPVELPK